MRKLLITGLLLVSLAGLHLLQAAGPGETGGNEPVMPVDTIKCKYYVEKDFKESVGTAASVKSENMEFVGGIVPHHLLAGRMIADFFNALAPQKPEVVIVVAPNHKRAGVSKIHTSGWSFETPFGVLQADSVLSGFLVKDERAAENLTLMEEEHSISSLVPYIKYYMPETKIVPVLLHGNYSLQDSIKLGKDLVENTKSEKAVIIASVDFSHYLPVKKADSMDEITFNAISNKDLEKISTMGNDNLDSPPSIITLLSAMESLKATGLKMLGHDNSSRIAGKESNSTTSYFTILFY